jgi:hypothetical protein
MKSFNEYRGTNGYPLQNNVELIENVGYETDQVEIGSTMYTLEVADNYNLISNGLSGRQIIPQKTGMLFVMPKQGIQEFWMKGCNVNMDIIFINEDNEIVNLHRMVIERDKMLSETDMQYEKTLKKYSSEMPARYAIEIPSGDITRLGLRVGDMINIER